MKLFLNNIYSISTTPNPLFDSILQLPTEINVVKGDTFQLFYKSSQVSVFDYPIRTNCSIGIDYMRYFQITDTETAATGDYTLTLEILDTDYLTVLATATTTIKFRDAVAEPSANHEFWCIGDSLTAQPYWHDEMERRLTGTGGTPVGNEYGNIVKRVEATAGVDWKWYTGSSSPFWFNGGLDFEAYRVSKGYDIPKTIYILMTWNGMGLYRDQNAWDVWDDDPYTFINAIQASFPNCDIVLMSPQKPSQTGGLGANYGAESGGYADYFLQVINCKKQGDIYDRIQGEIAKVRHLDTSLQFDSRYMMPQYATPVNTRATGTETIGTNGVHPDTKGYYQIADAGYRDFINNYCQ